MTMTMSWKIVCHSFSTQVSTNHAAVQKPSVSSSLPPYHSVLQSYATKKMNFVCGKTAELQHGDFLRITKTLRNEETDEVSFHGKRLRRTRNLARYITAKVNKVCWLEEISADGTDKPEKHPLGSVVRLRQLRMTNKRHADYKVSHIMDGKTPIEVVNGEWFLFCRYKFTAIYKNQESKKKAKTFKEKVLRVLDPNEVDEGWLDESMMMTRSRRMSSVTLIDDGDVQEARHPFFLFQNTSF